MSDSVFLWSTRMANMILILTFSLDVDDDYDEEDNLEAESGFVEPPSRKRFTIVSFRVFSFINTKVKPVFKVIDKLARIRHSFHQFNWLKLLLLTLVIGFLYAMDDME